MIEEGMPAGVFSLISELLKVKQSLLWEEKNLLTVFALRL
jgi:hypothetical protein